jgi:poly(beta-D-mannuronate) lyase
MKRGRFQSLPAVFFLLAAISTRGSYGATPGTSETTFGAQRNCSLVVGSVSALKEILNAPRAGMRVCLAPGEYRDVQIRIKIKASSEAPFVLAAQKPGTVIVTGRTRIQLYGSHIIVSGLRIERAVSASSQLIEFRAGDQLCDFCRLTETTIIDTDQNVGEADTKWVGVYGQHNRVDHCAFSGKTNNGGVLVIWRRPGIAERNRVDHNFFGSRPPLGVNGAEAIRVGTGHEQDSDSHSVIERNLFEKYDGEFEIISIKAGSTVVRNNTFIESAGFLTLRHGNGSLVEGNVFLANHKIRTGGVTVIGSGHRVIGNYIEGIRARRTEFGGIVLRASDAIPSPGGVQPVQNIIIQRNVIVDSENSFVFGAGPSGTVAPEKITVSENLIIRPSGPVVQVVVPLRQSTVNNNIVEGPWTVALADGFGPSVPGARTSAETKVLRLRPLTRADVGPTTYSPNVP